MSRTWTTRDNVASLSEYVQWGVFAESGGVLYRMHESGPATLAYDLATGLWTLPTQPSCNSYPSISGNHLQGARDPSGDSIWIAGDWHTPEDFNEKMAVVRWFPATNTHDLYLVPYSYDPDWGNHLFESVSSSNIVVTATHVMVLYVPQDSDARYSTPMMFVMDRSDNSWSEYAMPVTNRIAEFSMVGDTYLAYVVSGTDWDGAPDGRVYVFSPVTGSWATGAPSPDPQYAHCAVMSDGLIYVIGGDLASTSAWTAKISTYSFGADSWGEWEDLASRFDSPDGRALVYADQMWVSRYAYYLESLFIAPPDPEEADPGLPTGRTPLLAFSRFKRND